MSYYGQNPETEPKLTAEEIADIKDKIADNDYKADKDE